MSQRAGPFLWGLMAQSQAIVGQPKRAPLPPYLRVWDDQAVANAVSQAHAGYMRDLAAFWADIAEHDIVEGPLSRRLMAAGLPLKINHPSAKIADEIAALWSAGWECSTRTRLQAEQEWRKAYRGMGYAICAVTYQQQGGRLTYRLDVIPPHATGYNPQTDEYYVFWSRGGVYTTEKIPAVGLEWWVCSRGTASEAWRSCWRRQLASLFLGADAADDASTQFLKVASGQKILMAMPGATQEMLNAAAQAADDVSGNAVFAHAGDANSVEIVSGNAGASSAFDARIDSLRRRVSILLTGKSQDGTEVQGSANRAQLLAMQTLEILQDDSTTYGALATKSDSPMMRCLRQWGLPDPDKLEFGWDVSTPATLGSEMADAQAVLKTIADARALGVPLKVEPLLAKAGLELQQGGA